MNKYYRIMKKKYENIKLVFNADDEFIIISLLKEKYIIRILRSMRLLEKKNILLHKIFTNILVSMPTD